MSLADNDAFNFLNGYLVQTYMVMTLLTRMFAKLKFKTGKVVDALANEFKNVRNYTFDFNGSNLPSGVYFYTLKSNNLTQTKKMILLK